MSLGAKNKMNQQRLICIAPISTDNYLGSFNLPPSIFISPIWIASVWDDMDFLGLIVKDNLYIF